VLLVVEEVLDAHGSLDSESASGGDFQRVIGVAVAKRSATSHSQGDASDLKK